MIPYKVRENIACIREVVFDKMVHMSEDDFSMKKVKKQQLYLTCL